MWHLQTERVHKTGRAISVHSGAPPAIRRSISLASTATLMSRSAVSMVLDAIKLASVSDLLRPDTLATVAIISGDEPEGTSESTGLEAECRRRNSRSNWSSNHFLKIARAVPGFRASSCVTTPSPERMRRDNCSGWRYYGRLSSESQRSRPYPADRQCRAGGVGGNSTFAI